MNKKTWDIASIEQAYHDVIEPIGRILDQAQNLGLAGLLPGDDPLALYLTFIESIEQELFVQWKIKTEQGMDRLLAHQRGFITQDLRATQGCFAQYARLRKATLACPPVYGDCAWAGLVSDRAMDLSSYQTLEINPEQGAPFWELCLEMMGSTPHELWLGLLNLCELGSGPRFEPLDFFKPGLASGPGEETHQRLINAKQAKAYQEALTAFWAQNSGGLFSRYEAFLFRPDKSGDWVLQGDRLEKTCSFEQLYGVDRPVKQLCTMVQRFLNQEPYSHILLWGARGMGKSSSALGLINAFGSKGLRLVEVYQRDLQALPALFESIRGAKERFVLFLDDFGFELGNLEYKSLKSVFEGSLEQMPDNLLILATSNKKDLVSTPLIDPTRPESAQAEDEARALDDRFGLKLFFERPQFEDLKQLFGFVASKYALEAEVEALWPEFLRFARLHDHDKLSARTIEQFIAGKG